MRRLLFLNIAFLFTTIFSGCKKDDNNQQIVTKSSVSISDIVQERNSISTSNIRFFVNISPANPEEIKLNYTTQDGSAVAGKDYISSSGLLTIPANKTFAYIDVAVYADSLRQKNQTFAIKISSSSNVLIKGSGIATATILNNGTYLPVNNKGYTSASNYPEMKLIWNDEFNGKTLNMSSWSYDIGGSGWGNNELEYYTNSSKNSFLTGGYLVIEARKENYGSNNYTSARVLSKDKVQFTYGRIDIRAKLPKGQGIWPALWMLGSNISTNAWPSCGEIDIMELLGNNPKTIYGTIHWGQAGTGSTHIGSNYALTTDDFSSSFHLFSLLWKQDVLTFYVDDVPYFIANKSQITGTYPFDKPFFFILNVAVGGDWPGNPTDLTEFPQQMIVDYIRVFQ